MSNTYHHGNKNKEKLFGDNWQWHKQEPKWWVKIHKHRKQRAKTRLAIHSVMRNKYSGVEFPLDKKPWVYYW